MDSILISENSAVVEGLSQMMEAAVGPHDYVHGYVDVPIALFIVEIAKLAEDRPEWFPRGRWATIQSIQRRTHVQMINSFAERGFTLPGEADSEG